LKKLILFLLFNTLISLLFCSTTIITKYDDTFQGEIIKNDSHKIYFTDTKFPDFLFVINFQDIDSIRENEEDVTDKIANSKTKGFINFNSYKKIVNYNQKTNLESLLAAKEIDKNHDNKLNVMIKFTVEDGNFYLDGKRAFSPSGSSTSLEITNEIVEKLHFGAGFTFQFPSNLDKYFSCGESYQNNAFYGIVKINLITTNNQIDMLINANYGYNKLNLINSNSYFKDGTYSGFGLEMHVSKFVLEIGYKRFGGRYIDPSPDEIEAKTAYKSLSLSLGVKTL
jgi:hypothetical protein